MRQMVAHEPALAWAVSWMPLYDQLDLTLEVGQSTVTDGGVVRIVLDDAHT